VHLYLNIFDLCYRSHPLVSPCRTLFIKWVSAAVAANLPAETVSQFANDKIRSDRANANDICSALLKTLFTYLVQSHDASSSFSSSASDIANVATSIGAGRLIVLEDGSRRGISDGRKSQSIGDDYSVSTVLARSGSALPDVEYSIALLRSAFAVIQSFSSETNPRILNQSAEFLLNSTFNGAMRIRMMPNHHAHSRMVAVLALMESIVKRIHSTYAKFVSRHVCIFVITSCLCSA
jgi:hypothetical protein